MAVKTIGLLSPGDMGSVVAKVVQSHGLQVITCLKGRSERRRMLAHNAQIAEVPTYEDLVGASDLLWSIVVPESALDTARLVAGAIRSSGQQTIYVDCHAIAPGTVKAVAELITAAGSRFIDAGIIGPPPRQSGVRRFCTSGPEVEPFLALSNSGLDIRPLGRDIGLASGLKMCYAALTEGMTAIATELLITAQTMGLYEPLLAEWQISQKDRYRTIERQLPVMPTKASRWISEYGRDRQDVRRHLAAFTVYGISH